jgi:hypothetical protein
MEHREPQSRDSDTRIPWQQVLLDDVFVLLMAGLVVPTLFYIVWGLISLASVSTFGN